MNTIKKIFYRTFQGGMRILIPLFPYREPKLLSSIEEMIPVLKQNRIDRIMIVTGRNIHRLGLTLSLEALLKENEIFCAIYAKTDPDPSTENVEEALKVYKENDCQCIVAFGGGSPMDCAKAVGARVARPKMPVHKMAGLIKIRRATPLIIAVPTTAGTGSETTVAAVITDPSTHRKFVISDFCLIPKYALLLPEVTVGLPPHVTATTGMDALTHAIEAYVGRAKTKETRLASERATKLIFENLERAFCDGSDIEARSNMLHASYLAGTAFTKSYVGYVHAIAHTIGGRYKISHGLANAIILPHVLRAYGSAVYKPLSELARAIGLVDANATDEHSAEILISKIEEMNAGFGIPTSLECIKKEDIPEMARLADKEANPLYPVPVLWDAKELENLYLQLSVDRE